MFKTKIYSSFDYIKVIGRLKRRIDDRHFFKGYFDKKESVVYYYSDTLPNPMDTNYFPLIEIKIYDLKEDSRGVQIDIKIIVPILIIMGVAVMGAWIGFGLVISDYGLTSIPAILIPLTATIAFPSILKGAFDKELFHFKLELKKIEDEMRDIDLDEHI
jgi:hypothetical protein